MEKDIKRLGKLFSKIDGFASTPKRWRNIALAQEAFELMTTRLPLRVEGELSPYTRVRLLDMMMECVDELDVPRFALKVREYQLSMRALIDDAQNLATDTSFDDYTGDAAGYRRQLDVFDDVERARQKLADYIDPAVSDDEWMERYHATLRFSPVERTEQWEEVIYEVERRCYNKTRLSWRGMGFCFKYWSIKRDVLAAMGIDWQSPQEMNPRCRFD